MTSEYWINREKEKLKAHLGDVTKTEKILHRNLKKASKDIEEEIYKLYSRYSKENRLSYTEANKLLTGPKYKEWRMDLKDYVDEINKTDNKELLLELNTLSAKSSITGLEEQLYQIQKILDRDYIFKHKEVKKLLKTGVKNSFTQTAYTIENLNGFHSSFSMINQKDIEDTINLPWSGKNYSSRLWANRTKLKDKVQEQIVQATIQGKDLRQCIKELSDTMEATREVTKRLINTEHAYACSQGDLKMYEEFGIDRYEYVATLDSKTSNICRGLDGKVYKRSEAISGVNFPPMHPHCRSTTVPADVETLGDETRIAKDIKGNYIYLKANTTYEDYIKALETGNWSKVASKNTIDYMGQKNIFSYKRGSKDYSITAYASEKLLGLFKQTNSSNSQDMENYLVKKQSDIFENGLPKNIVITNARFKGLAAYDYTVDTLYIREDLIDKNTVKEMLKDGEFASMGLDDILLHEYGHKIYWDKAKELYNSNKKLYNSVIEASIAYEEPLRKYIKTKLLSDKLYVMKNISKYAYRSLLDMNFREVYSELYVLIKNKKIQDKALIKIMEELL